MACAATSPRDSLPTVGACASIRRTGATGGRTNDDALAALKEQLGLWGLDPAGLQVVDGSGLSRRDTLAPDTLVGVLERGDRCNGGIAEAKMTGTSSLALGEKITPYDLFVYRAVRALRRDKNAVAYHQVENETIEPISPKLMELEPYRDLDTAATSCIGTAMAAIFSANLAGGLAVGGADLAWLFLFGAVNLGLGLALYVTGARLVPAAVATLVSTIEPVLAPVWVWLVHGEVPGGRTLLGGAIIFAALLFHFLAELRRQRTGLRP